MKKIIIANWKIYLDRKSSLSLLSKIKFPGLRSKVFDLVVCPSFTVLSDVQKAIAHMSLAISLGAQNCFWQNHGAYTGEISPTNLKDLGVKYVIIGHSERRAHLKETDEMINLKLKAALATGLAPVFCVGETAEERDGGRAEASVLGQIQKGLAGLKVKNSQKILIAYEPVWAIGTGKSCEPKDAVKMHQFIKKEAAQILDKEEVSMLYGGSVDEKNVLSYLEEVAIDGVLVGGASVKPEIFSALLKKAVTLKA